MDKVLQGAKDVMLKLIEVGEVRTLNQFVGNHSHRYNATTVQTALTALVNDGKLEEVDTQVYRRVK